MDAEKSNNNRNFNFIKNENASNKSSGDKKSATLANYYNKSNSGSNGVNSKQQRTQLPNIHDLNRRQKAAGKKRSVHSLALSETGSNTRYFPVFISYMHS